MKELCLWEVDVFRQGINKLPSCGDWRKRTTSGRPELFLHLQPKPLIDFDFFFLISISIPSINYISPNPHPVFLVFFFVPRSLLSFTSWTTCSFIVTNQCLCVVVIVTLCSASLRRQPLFCSHRRCIYLKMQNLAKALWIKLRGGVLLCVCVCVCYIFLCCFFCTNIKY